MATQRTRFPTSFSPVLEHAGALAGILGLSRTLSESSSIDVLPVSLAWLRNLQLLLGRYFIAPLITKCEGEPILGEKNVGTPTVFSIRLPVL
jgi:hypothetical protein